MVDWAIKELEPREILATQPAHPGWQACYVCSYSRENHHGEFIVLPVVLWVTVAFADGEYQRQEVRPFVARVTGEIVDAQDIDLAFVCLTPPDRDPIATAQTILEHEDTVIVHEQDNEELVS